MLYKIFSVILKMNITTAAIAIIILCVRLILERLRFPRKIIHLLWIIIAFRLVCPFSVSSDLSLLNLVPPRSAIEATQVREYTKNAEIILSDNKIIAEGVGNSNLPDPKNLISIIWLIGVGAMLLYGLTSYLMLKRRLRFATKYKCNIYISQNITIPFVFGSFKPRIYIPENIYSEDLDYIILHEQAHIKRADNITKIIAYVILSVHWINPLNHIMFKIFSTDLELLCDEEVIKHMSSIGKMQYANTILSVAAEGNAKNALICGMGVSHTSIKRRIKEILNNKKTSKLILSIGIVVLIFVFAVTGTNRQRDINSNANIEIPEAKYETTTTAYDTEVEINTPQTPKETTEFKPADDSDGVIKNYTKGYSENIKTNNDIDYRVDVALDTTSADDTVSNNTEVKASGKYQSGAKDVLYGISSDENGELNLHFDINTETLVGVTLINSETKEKESSFTMLAGGENTYTVSDLDTSKIYDIEVQGKTSDEWKIEGEYYIY